MKTQLILGAVLLAAISVQAQKQEKKATVRIKKVENINGVEKVSDTTYVTNDLSQISSGDETIDIKETHGKDGKVKRVITVNSKNESKAPGTSQTVVMSADDLPDGVPEISINDSGKPGQVVMIKKAHCGATPEELKEVNSVSVIIVKNIDITNASQEDLKRLGGASGMNENALLVDKMEFYPNPNNGKFNLRFSLKEKANTNVSVLNMEGKQIYSEKLDNFSGTYDREIDISKNPKGVYFVRVSQGNTLQLKKIIVE